MDSLSLFVGTGECNAHCAHCAGKIHRKYAPKEDGIVDENLIFKTLKDSYFNGAKSLSLSSSGEPTLSPKSVSKIFEIIQKCKDEGINYSPINLYSNGIRIGKDKNFCDKYLPLWKNNGLSAVYVTVHDINEKNNAKIYGVSNYPNLEIVLLRIHDANLLMRANLVLSKRTIDSLEKFVETITHLKKIGVDFVSVWPIRGIDDKIDPILSPNENELGKIEDWVANQCTSFKVKLLREKNRKVYETGKKLTLFPDGKLSNTWCNY